MLGDAGLSSREGCGNTVRNVTGDPYAGVSADELFDLTPYVGAYVRYFVRHPRPSSCRARSRPPSPARDADRAITGIHDVALHRRAIARRRARRRDARRRRHLDHAPRRARRSTTSCEVDNGEYLKVTEAVLRIFDRQDWLRVNRARARIKVLVDKIGIDAFREQVEEELQGDWVARARLRPDAAPVRLRRGGQRPRRRRDTTGSPERRLSEFDRFRAANVQPQRQPGFSTVPVKVTRGDLTPEQFRGLAAIMRDFTRRLRPHDRPPEPPAALGARRSRSTTSGPAEGARPRRRRRRRDHRRRLLPRHRLAASSASPARWASTRRSRSASRRWRSTTR